MPYNVYGFVFCCCWNYLIETGRLQSFSKRFANSSQICDRFLTHWFGDKISMFLWCARHIYSIWFFLSSNGKQNENVKKAQVAGQIQLDNMTKFMKLQRNFIVCFNFNVNVIGMTNNVSPLKWRTQNGNGRTLFEFWLEMCQTVEYHFDRLCMQRHLAISSWKRSMNFHFKIS